MTTCYSTCTSQTKIRKYLTQESCEIAVHVFITSKLDYCNSLLYGCRKMQLKKLQYVQNAAARIVTQNRKFYNITPVLFDPHWLPVSYRIVSSNLKSHGIVLNKHDESAPFSLQIAVGTVDRLKLLSS